MFSAQGDEAEEATLEEIFSEHGGKSGVTNHPDQTRNFRPAAMVLVGLMMLLAFGAWLWARPGRASAANAETGPTNGT